MGENLQPPQDWVEPELLPVQLQLKDLADEILALKPETNPLTNIAFEIDLMPDVVDERLKRSSFSQLLLPDGASLSASPPNEYHHDLGLFVGDAELVKVWVRAWGWKEEKYRKDPNGPDKPPFDIIRFPGEEDWVRQLDISLHYQKGIDTASQTITSYDSSCKAGLPSLSRDVYASAYAETGYEGHNQAFIDDRSEDQVLEFLAIARELFTNHKSDQSYL